MHIAEYENVPDADAIRTEAERLDIERHLLEMHTYGVTIIPPETLGAGDLIDRLRDGILRVLAERHEIDAHAWILPTHRAVPHRAIPHGQ